MKDRIKFNDAMLAAVMDGRKTQTRRPMKVQPVLNGNWWEVYGAGWGRIANQCQLYRVTL